MSKRQIKQVSQLDLKFRNPNERMITQKTKKNILITIRNAIKLKKGAKKV